VTDPDDTDDLGRRAKAGDRDALDLPLAQVRPRTLAICRRPMSRGSE
jgi:RNA polymerase sigma-70 factor (ECF subfamily)